MRINREISIRLWCGLVLLLVACAMIGMAADDVLVVTPEPVTLTLTVGGAERMALVYPGRHAETQPAPVIFVFHGFTGSAAGMSTTKFHIAWSDATVVYPQGLPIHSRRQNRDVPAWQTAPGKDDDRDVLFVDALFDELGKRYKIDERRVYAVGVSNGGFLVYTLLTMRPERFTAFGIVASCAGFVRQATVPRPVIIIQGKNDKTVKPQAAMETRDLLRQLNGCGTEEQAWTEGYVSYQPCISGCPVVWRLHSGGHIWPGEATSKITRFLKEQVTAEKADDQ